MRVRFPLLLNLDMLCLESSLSMYWEVLCRRVVCFLFIHFMSTEVLRRLRRFMPRTRRGFLVMFVLFGIREDSICAWIGITVLLMDGNSALPGPSGGDTLAAARPAQGQRGDTPTSDSSPWGANGMVLNTNQLIEDITAPLPEGQTHESLTKREALVKKLREKYFPGRSLESLEKYRNSPNPTSKGERAMQFYSCWTRRLALQEVLEGWERKSLQKTLKGVSLGVREGCDVSNSSTAYYGIIGAALGLASGFTLYKSYFWTSKRDRRALREEAAREQIPKGLVGVATRPRESFKRTSQASQSGVKGMFFGGSSHVGGYLGTLFGIFGGCSLWKRYTLYRDTPQRTKAWRMNQILHQNTNTTATEAVRSWLEASEGAKQVLSLNIISLLRRRFQCAEFISRGGDGWDGFRVKEPRYRGQKATLDTDGANPQVEAIWPIFVNGIPSLERIHAVSAFQPPFLPQRNPHHLLALPHRGDAPAPMFSVGPGGAFQDPVGGERIRANAHLISRRRGATALVKTAFKDSLVKTSWKAEGILRFRIRLCELEYLLKR